MSNRLKELAFNEIKTMTDDIASDLLSSIIKIDEEYYERNFSHSVRLGEENRISDALSQIKKTEMMLVDLTNAIHFYREGSYLDSLAWSTDTPIEKKEPDFSETGDQ